MSDEERWKVRAAPTNEDHLRQVAILSEGHCPECTTRLGERGWCATCQRFFWLRHTGGLGPAIVSTRHVDVAVKEQ